ncbi:hypothetical protein [Salinicola rhizosphaerae]|nr:hypothetical protein [Salinicola rhizosphaerae]
MDYSIELESARGNLTQFQVNRLAQMVSKSGTGLCQTLIRDALVAEIERDYAAFDVAAERLIAHYPGESGMLLNMSNVALFTFDADIALKLLKLAMSGLSTDARALHHIAPVAWNCGDLELLMDVRRRLASMNGESESMRQWRSDEAVVNVLDGSGVGLDEYRAYVRGFYKLVREHTANLMNTRVGIDIDAVTYEDGQGKVVLQVFADLDPEALEALDEALIDRDCDETEVSPQLAGIVSCLARDFPANRVREVMQRDA